MTNIRYAKQIFSRIAAAMQDILGSAGGDALHGVHYGFDQLPHHPKSEVKSHGGSIVNSHQLPDEGPGVS